MEFSSERRQAFFAKVQAESDAELTALFGAETVRRLNQQERTGPTGPRTQAGKQKSRVNAYRHGLCGKKILLFTPEEKAEFDIHCQGIVASLAPVGALETDLAQTIAECRWRLKRSRAMESNLYALGFTAPTEPARTPQERLGQDAQLELQLNAKFNKEIQLFGIYEGRIQRTLDRSMAEFRTLSAERHAARQQILEEELLLAELAESEGQTYEATPNSVHPEFVYTTTEVLQALTRKKRLQAARELIQKRQNLKSSRQTPASA